MKRVGRAQRSHGNGLGEEKKLKSKGKKQARVSQLSGGKDSFKGPEGVRSIKLPRHTMVNSHLQVQTLNSEQDQSLSNGATLVSQAPSQELRISPEHSEPS